MNRPRFCSFIVAVILRVGLAIQVTGCATVGLPNPTIADVRDTVSVVLQLTLLLAVVALVITIVRRSFRKRHGTVIVPFDVNSPDGKYSGKAIADAIASELMRIQRMHSTELFKEWKLDNPQFGERRKLAGVLPPRSKPVTMPPLQSKADAGARIPDVAVELAGTKFSLASVMQGIQYLWTGRDPEVVVTGSLQVFGKHVRIVARLDRAGASLEGEPERSSSCIIREAASKIETEDQIPDLLRDLTFQLWMELLDPKLRFTKTWQGLKHFTDALAGYEDFSVSGTSDDLDRATDRAFAAVRAEPNTTAFFNLLFQLGGHPSELGKYEEAARLLDQAVKLRSVGEASSTDDTVGAELAQAYNALGVCYAYQGDYPHAEVSFRRALRHNE